MGNWKVKAVVRLKEGVLDVQGRAVEKAMRQIGYPDVSGVRIGKYVEFLTAQKPENETLKEMGERLLANPTIETIEYSVEPVSQASG